MRLEGISAEIRPRNPWEAIDLGCVLTRRHYGAVLKAWCMTVVPLWSLILGIMHHNPVAALWVIWWLKPVTERVPLLVLSRALFGERLSWRELLREWPRMIGRRVWSTLIWRRLSPVRSLVAPVLELEASQGQRLRGEEFDRRKMAIISGAGTAAFWLQTMVLMVLHGSWIGLLLIGYLMVPARHRPELEVLWAEWGQPGALAPMVALWTGLALYLVSLSLVTPFFVGGGFGLYLNSRTRLEGWDVELAFRRMGNRLRGAGVAVALLIGLGVAALPRLGWSAEAAIPGGAFPAGQPKEVIAQVLQDRTFEVHKMKIFRLKEHKREPLFDLPEFHIPLLGEIGNALVWLTLGTFALFVAYLLVRAVMAGRGGEKGRRGLVRKRPPVKTVMGLNVEEEKLPPDLVSAARSLWQRGDTEGAVRLLYRGAVSWLIHRAGVPIRESDTEVDCLVRVRSEGLPEAGYFGDLTRMWVLSAYGKQSGGADDMAGLFDHWPFSAPAKGGQG